jgi:hypothetical protein
LTAKEILAVMAAVAPDWRATAYRSQPYSKEEEAEHDYWYTRVPDLGSENRGLEYLRSSLRATDYPIAGVNVGPRSGRLGEGNSYHWVAVSGLSAQWTNGWEWRWVRIYNPFNNQKEYYPWDFFHDNWNFHSIPDRRTLIVLSP